MIKFPLLFGSVRHMKLVGQDPRHADLRYRNEARLKALKASGKLYEDKDVKNERADYAAALAAGAANCTADELAKLGAQQHAGPSAAGFYSGTLTGLGIGWWHDFGGH